MKTWHTFPCLQWIRIGWFLTSVGHRRSIRASKKQLIQRLKIRKLSWWINYRNLVPTKTFRASVIVSVETVPKGPCRWKFIIKNCKIMSKNRGKKLSWYWSVSFHRKFLVFLPLLLQKTYNNTHHGRGFSFFYELWKWLVETSCKMDLGP